MADVAGRVLFICISPEKGTKKREISSARLIDNWGIEGDAHAGAGNRQVSLLAFEEIEKIKSLIPSLKPGDFAENIVTQGVDLNQIEIGDQLIIGDDIYLEVSQIGKKCHSGCEIQKLTGKCIMPKKGVFAKVLGGGLMKKDDNLRAKKINIKGISNKAYVN